ncbi:MAG: DUF6491 family protein [Lysobacter sp.]
MKSILLAVAAVFALSACATGPTLSDPQRLAIHQAHAGAPVNSFSHFGTLYSWEPLGDSALTVWVRPQTAYLLTLASDCPNLEHGHAISLGDQTGTVFAGMDNVTVSGQGFPIPCRIKTIQPIDAKALKDAEREARDALQASAGGT